MNDWMSHEEEQSFTHLVAVAFVFVIPGEKGSCLDVGLNLVWYMVILRCRISDDDVQQVVRHFRIQHRRHSDLSTMT